MPVIKGVTTSSHIRGELEAKYRKAGIPMATNPKGQIPTTRIEMWTGKIMDGVDDLGNPIKVPLTIDIPFGGHINTGETLDMAREKGFMTIDEMPTHIKALYDQASNRNNKGGFAGLAASALEMDGLGAKQPVVNAKEGTVEPDLQPVVATCSATTAKGTKCIRKAQEGTEFCHIHNRGK